MKLDKRRYGWEPRAREDAWISRRSPSIAHAIRMARLRNAQQGAEPDAAKTSVVRG